MGSFGSAHELGQTIENQVPVRQTGERVVEREIIQSLLPFDVGDRKRHIARELDQQALFLVMEEVSLSGIQRQHADGFIGDDQRQDGQRADTMCRMLLAGQYARVVAGIVADADLFVAQGAHHVRPFQRLGRAVQQLLCNGVQIRCLHSSGRDGDQPVDATVDRADPACREAAFLNGYSTGLAKQILAVVNFDDQSVDAAQDGVDAVQIADPAFGCLAGRDIANQDDDVDGAVQAVRVTSNLDPH